MSQTVQQAAAANSQGMTALRQRDFKAAAEAFERAVAADPHSGALLRNLASAHRGAGDDAAEREALERALDVDRRDVVAGCARPSFTSDVGRMARRSKPGMARLRWPSSSSRGADRWRNRLTRPSIRDGGVGGAPPSTASSGRLPPSLTMRRRAGRRRSSTPHSVSGESSSMSAMASATLPAGRRILRRPAFPLVRGAVRGDRRNSRRVRGVDQGSGQGAAPLCADGIGHRRNKWPGLDNSLDWGAIFLWEHGEPNRPIIERCPKTANVLESLPVSHIPGRAPSAFFSMLKPQRGFRRIPG